MTELALTPLVLGHVAITLVAIASGLWVLAHLVKGSLPTHSNQVFLLFTFLTSATGFLIAPGAPAPTPAQITGVIAILTLALALYAFYGRHLQGRWRATYLVTAIIGLYLNVFVLVIQLFLKVPALHARPRQAAARCSAQSRRWCWYFLRRRGGWRCDAINCRRRPDPVMR